jgi:hypothetical protein
MKHAHNFIDLTGKIFGKLTVLKLDCIRKQKTYWFCLCVCGGTKSVLRDSLQSGRTQSCGCIHKEQLSIRNTTVLKKHGMEKTSFYHIWSGILQRCNNPNSASYPNYGGRGVAVCKRWLKFENFRDDMYASYLKHVVLHKDEGVGRNTSIDRFPNKSGNYEPANCRWATQIEQQNNRRSNSQSHNVELHIYWRTRLNHMVQQCLHGNRKSKTFQKYIGCSVFEFKKYIMKQFKDGMTWDNWGPEIWQWNLDHIIACRHFDLSKEEDRLKCFNYTNYQPLWWKENHDKVKTDNEVLVKA